VRLPPYSERVRQLFAAPAHAGCLDGAIRVRHDAQGVRLCLCAEIESDTVTKLRFRAYGCPHLIAAAEAFCAACEGQPAGALLEFSAQDLIQTLDVPRDKAGRILVLEDAIRMLGSSLPES